MLFVGLGVAVGRANAGAWSPPAGVGQSITSVSKDEADFGDKWRAEDYFEYGFGAGWGLHFKAEAELATTPGVAIRLDDAQSDYRIGVQKSFAIGERAAVAVQASALAGDALDGLLCGGSGYEARALAGTSFSLLGRSGFVDVEAGYRSRGSQCERVVGEATLGFDLTDNWSVVAKTWGEEGDDVRSQKVEAELYRSFGNFRLGLGYREEVGGRFEEKGVVVMFGTRF